MPSASWIAIGAGMGVALCTAFGQSAVGLAIGAAFGKAAFAWQRQHQNDKE